MHCDQDYNQHFVIQKHLAILYNIPVVQRLDVIYCKLQVGTHESCWLFLWRVRNKSTGKIWDPCSWDTKPRPSEY